MLLAEIEAMQEELTAQRLDIHAHPERVLRKIATDFVAQKLEEFGIQVHQWVRPACRGVAAGQ